MSKRERRATWFKCFLSSKATVDAIPDENVGKGLKAAFAYFDNKTIPPLDPLSNVVFCAMRPYIDEAFSDYEASVRAGQSGAAVRWDKGGANSPPMPSLWGYVEKQKRRQKRITKTEIKEVKHRHEKEGDRGRKNRNTLFSGMSADGPPDMRR